MGMHLVVSGLCSPYGDRFHTIPRHHCSHRTQMMAKLFPPRGIRVSLILLLVAERSRQMMRFRLPITTKSLRMSRFASSPGNIAVGPEKQINLQERRNGQWNTMKDSRDRTDGITPNAGLNTFPRSTMHYTASDWKDTGLASEIWRQSASSGREPPCCDRPLDLQPFL